MKYRVHATRAGKWWAIDTRDADHTIHTQARRLDQVAGVAADAITLWYADEDGRTVSADDVELVVHIEHADLERLVVDARRLRAEAECATAAASAAMVAAAKVAQAEGLSVRDTGELLGVSFQRAAVLSAS